MEVIFDIKADENWAFAINEDIKSEFPDYFPTSLL